MPVRLIGKKSKNSGKTLWEIVGNLKNFGVGRLVYKDFFTRYPECSYYKIVKVQPVVAPKEKYIDRKVMVWAEHVFRGVKFPDLVPIYASSAKAMFRLIPKSEETKYFEAKSEKRVHEIPAFREIPPLMEILLEREAKRQGKTVAPLKTVIAGSVNGTAVIKESDELLKYSTPKLFMEFSVAELEAKLQELKTAAGTDTPPS